MRRRKTIYDELFNDVILLEDGVKNLESMLQDKFAGEDLLDQFRSIEELCETVQAKIKEVRLPMLKPVICELTDAGPGVGVSNHEVCFRAAQRVRILASDYFIRFHLAPGDSSNEVERCQSLIGDAIVDTIKWKYKDVPAIEEI
eukprot:Seg1753.4 transcript_id=Seg1753.4/GoldUCD/mRNA.D3Y31 product="hypothetical protein" protein_id=Seg1753.4/GoldUCD/D3Y31